MFSDTGKKDTATARCFVWFLLDGVNVCLASYFVVFEELAFRFA